MQKTTPNAAGRFLCATGGKKLDAFLQFNERDILTNAGKVTKEIADRLALEQYETFYSNRLSTEARDEALTDDEELKKIESTIEKKKKQRHK